MKRITGAMGLVVVLVLVVVGCGGNAPQTTPDAPTAQIAGEWVGVFQSATKDTAANGQVTTVITQNDKAFVASGKVQANCFTAFTAVDGNIVGNSITLTLKTNDMGKTDVHGGIILATQTINATYQVVSGACVGNTGTLTLTRK